MKRTVFFPLVILLLVTPFLFAQQRGTRRTIASRVEELERRLAAIEEKGIKRHVFAEGGTVTAERFVLVDAEGVNRGGIVAESNGSAAMVLHAPGSAVGIALTVTEEGEASMLLVREADGPGVCIEVPTNTGPTITLLGPNRRVPLFLSLDADGSPSIVLCNPRDIPQLVMTASNGRGSMTIHDVSSEAMITMSMDKQDGPGFTCTGRNGRIAWFTGRNGRIYSK